MLPFLTWSQTPSSIQKIDSFNRTSYAKFGHSVVAGDDMLIVGAPFESIENSNGQNVNRAGAVYCYTINSDSTWTIIQKITPRISTEMDNFGYSIARYENTLVVSAPRKTTGYNSGKVYVFTYDGEKWTEETTLSVSDTQNKDDFGHSVDIYQNQIVIGSPYHTVTRNNLSVKNLGAAYVFSKTNNSWVFDRKISPSDGNESDNFGLTVKCTNDHIVVAAPNKDVAVNQSNSGAVYVYSLEIQNFKEQKLIANKPVAYGYFGKSIAIENNTLIIGSNGDQYSPNDDVNLQKCGSISIYTNQNKWSLLQKIYDNQKSNYGRFGSSVAIKNNMILVGSTEDYSSGKASLFYSENGKTWWKTSDLRNQYGNTQDQLGNACALGNNYAIVGSPQDSHDKLENNYTYQAGSATIFKYTSSTPIIGQIENQTTCNEDTVRIPFTVFNKNASHSNGFNISSTNEDAVPNDDNHLFIEKGNTIVMIPSQASYQSTTDITLEAINGHSSSTTTFKTYFNRPKTNWDTKEVCFGDSVYVQGAYRKETDKVYCDTIYNTHGCYDLQCTYVTVKQEIDTTITRLTSNTVITNTPDYEKYKWVNCDSQDEAFGINTLPTYTTLNDGWYAVDITSNECTVRSECYYFGDNFVNSINKYDDEGISLTWNNTYKSLSIYLNTSTEANLFIYNSLGQIILVKKVFGSEQILLTNNTSGLYIAKVQNQHFSNTLKLVLE
jgi:hypothetical protein